MHEDLVVTALFESVGPSSFNRKMRGEMEKIAEQWKYIFSRPFPSV